MPGMSLAELITYGPHVAMGVVVLYLFWRTLLSVKGGAVHRRHGRWYLLVVVPLLLSVLPIMLKAVADEGPVKIVQLVYLGIVFGAAAWTAWRAVKDKREPDRFRGPVFKALGGALVAFGALLMVMGIATHNLLAFGFSTIGIVYGGAMLGFLGREAEADWWRAWHLNGVCLLFAATHASFVGLVLRTLRPEWDGAVLHAMTQLGTIAFAYLLRQALGWRYMGRRAPAALPA